MRGVYVLRDTITTVTTAKELLYLKCPADSVVEILSARVTCINEDTSEQMHITLARVSGTVAGGDALTPEPLETGSQVSGCTAKGGNTAITGLTQEADHQAIASHGANKLAGWHYVPLPEERHILSPNEEVTLELIIDLANSSNLSCEIVFREIGG